MEKKIALTGIKPTGIPHIGNYLGSIRPGLELAEKFRAFYFIADYHALNSIKDPKILREMSIEVAATWLACGLNPEEVMLYKQSAVPETFELFTILSCFTPKGLMNRAHAYKAKVADNLKNKKVPDDNVNMGMFSYPVLMAADILLFDADYVPVGKDQLQHIEMAIDIAQSLNYTYGEELIKIPQAYVREETQTIIGLDGRKMSKSYNNTIPLFLPPKKLRKMIMKIVTNSQTIEEPKDPEKCNVFSLYKLFADKDEIANLQEKYLAGGMGWGQAKQELFEKIDSIIAPKRERYFDIMKNKDYIEQVLKDGSIKARELCADKMERLRSALGVK